MRLFLFLVTLLFVSIFENSQAFGQKPDNPRISIQYKGPVGRTKSVGFLNNDARIFACGQNKAVDLFDIEQGKAVHGNSIRWEFARGPNGDINCASNHTSSEVIFLAGWSARGKRDITIADIRTGSIVGVLPNNSDSKAHESATIVHVTMNPSKDYAASSDEHGGIWMWDLTRGIIAAVEYSVREKLNTPKVVNGQTVQEVTTVSFSPLAFVDNSNRTPQPL